MFRKPWKILILNMIAISYWHFLWIHFCQYSIAYVHTEPESKCLAEQGKLIITVVILIISTQGFNFVKPFPFGHSLLTSTINIQFCPWDLYSVTLRSNLQTHIFLCFHSDVVKRTKNDQQMALCGCRPVWWLSVWCVADVNECSKDPVPCKEDQYCLNTEGSYSCKGKRSYAKQ